MKSNRFARFYACFMFAFVFLSCGGLKDSAVENIKNSNFILREGIDDVRATVGEAFYPDRLPEGFAVKKPYRSGKQFVVPVTLNAPTGTVKVNIYLDYDEKAKISFVDRIDVIDKETHTASTFEEKYQVILMLLSGMRS